MGFIHQVVLGMWSILPGNYSGITHIHDNLYAVVDDKEQVDGFKYLTLEIDSVKGKIRHASMEEPMGMTKRRNGNTFTYRDCEGVAYFPEQHTIFVTGEKDQRILEYTMEGNPTGRELQIPECMNIEHITFNLGFEALSYNAVQQRFWTTTESTLPADGPQSSCRDTEVRNHLRLVAFDDSLRPVTSYVYCMDTPKEHSRKAISIHGVPSIIALDDGRLIIMEREGCFPRKEYGSRVRIKLYMVDPKRATPVSLNTPMADVKEEMYLQKELITSFTTRLRIGKMNLANYEGMCLGPKLQDGRQTILLIADSQNGMGNWLYHLKDYMRLVAIPLE